MEKIEQEIRAAAITQKYPYSPQADRKQIASCGVRHVAWQRSGCGCGGYFYKLCGWLLGSMQFPKPLATHAVSFNLLVAISHLLSLADSTQRNKTSLSSESKVSLCCVVVSILVEQWLLPCRSLAATFSLISIQLPATASPSVQPNPQNPLHQGIGLIPLLWPRADRPIL